MPALRSLLGAIADWSLAPLLERVTRPTRLQGLRSHGELRHAALMDELDAKLTSLLQLVPAYSPIMYLDYPVHHNIGDLMICAGTEAFFRRARYQVLCRLSLDDLCSWRTGEIKLRERTVRLLHEIPGHVPIVFHGGGNFGDLYPHHQAARCLVAARSPQRKIVVLPQSVHFDRSELAAEQFAMFARHPDFHLCVRDRYSEELARRHGLPNVWLFPDMAHALWREKGWGLRQTATRRRGLLEFKRRDMERTRLQAREHTFDWSDLIDPLDRLFGECMHSAMSRSLDPNFQLLYRFWYVQRDRLIDRARDLVARFERVDTDRLHAVILAALLGIPVRASDNSYGKITRYVDTWLRGDMLIDGARVYSAA